jgi:hypothetical protein
MPKVTKQSTPPKNTRSFYALHRWEAKHYKDRSEIEAYVEASGKTETVLTVHPTSGASAEAIAVFVCHLINHNQKNKNLLLDAMEALELCMNEADMTFATEQAADRVVTNIKQVVGKK